VALVATRRVLGSSTCSEAIAFSSNMLMLAIKIEETLAYDKVHLLISNELTLFCDEVRIVVEIEGPEFLSSK
jgi:hypothetical protein